MRVLLEMVTETVKGPKLRLMGMSTPATGKMTSMMEREFWYGLMERSTMAIGKPTRPMGTIRGEYYTGYG